MSRLWVRVPRGAPKNPAPALKNDGATESQSAAGMVCGIPFHKTCQLDAILSAMVEVKTCMVSRWLNWLLLWGDFMKDNIMYYPAIVLMIVEASALIFLIIEWIKANKNNK